MKIKFKSEFLNLLTLLFIGLKLTGHIDWNWFWVLLPMLLWIIGALIVIAIKKEG